jgi:hypothetical protein
VVFDLKGSSFQLDLGLCDVGNGSKGKAMLAPVVSPFILQSIEFLEEAIDCLMSCSRHGGAQGNDTRRQTAHKN